MTGRLALITLPMLASCAACGPTTSLRNDEKTTVYVDFVANDVPRPPSPQKLVSGQIMTAPWPPADARTLYVGSDPAKLRQLPVAKLCDLKKRNCNLRLSELPLGVADGS
jgi:hypothetical protein